MADIDELDLQELQAFMGGGAPSAAPESKLDTATIPQPPGFGGFGSAPAANGSSKAVKDDASGSGGYASTPAPKASPFQAPKETAQASPELAAPPGIDQARVAEEPKVVPPKHDRLVNEATAKVVVENDEDPTLPYLSVKSWEELSLSKEILDGVYEHGFVKPSKIQEVALPIVMTGGNLVGQAQNGSGKTAAFALSLLHKVEANSRCVQGMCVNPTRELARQNADVIEKLGKFTGIKVFLAVPQCSFSRKIDTHIIVGTPGKIQDLTKRRAIDSRNMKMFVIDEADTMIDEDQGMGAQVFSIRSMLPQETQVLLFSATFPEHVEQFAKRMVPKAHRIKVQKEDLTLNTILQSFIICGDDATKKQSVLSDLYAAMNIGQSIIFVNSRQKAFHLAKSMKEEGHSVSLICGTQANNSGNEQIDPAYRDKVMDEFRNGVTKVLIATDVLSRGIDVPAVTLVVNFDIPMKGSFPEFETYQHRIGRTGRFGLKGIAVNLVTNREIAVLDEIKRYYKCEMKQMAADCEEIERSLKGLR